MRVFIAAALAVSLSATSLFAADTGSLVPGQAAGVKKAQLLDTTGWWIAGGVVFVGVVALAASNNSGGVNAAAATSTSQ